MNTDKKGKKISFDNVMAIDINAGSLFPKLGEFDCMYVVRIYASNRKCYARAWFGRN